MHIQWLSLISVVMWVACTDPNLTGPFACDDEGRCRDGYECVNGFCCPPDDPSACSAQGDAGPDGDIFDVGTGSNFDVPPKSDGSGSPDIEVPEALNDDWGVDEIRDESEVTTGCITQGDTCGQRDGCEGDSCTTHDENAQNVIKQPKLVSCFFLKFCQ